MALTVDRFDLLWNEISTSYKATLTLDFKSWTIKDALTAVGTGYLTYKALTLSWRTYKSFKEYGLSKIVAKPSLIRTYGGTWAGSVLRHLVCDLESIKYAY